MTSRDEVLPLDPNLYRIAQDAKEFYKAETGITDHEVLKEHIMAVTTKGCAVLPTHARKSSPSLSSYIFLAATLRCLLHADASQRFELSRLDIYPDILRMGHENPDAIVLDFWLLLSAYELGTQDFHSTGVNILL